MTGRGPLGLAALVTTVALAGIALAGEVADDQPGGPDFWAVASLPKGTTLTLKVEPGESRKTLAALPSGARLANLGCRRLSGERRWCKVRTPAGETGWVIAAFLQEWPELAKVAK